MTVLNAFCEGGGENETILSLRQQGAPSLLARHILQARLTVSGRTSCAPADRPLLDFQRRADFWVMILQTIGAQVDEIKDSIVVLDLVADGARLAKHVLSLVSSTSVLLPGQSCMSPPSRR